MYMVKSMNLRIIYGRAKTGKSQYIFEEVSSRIEQEDQIYIITPEQFSFTAEKKLMNQIEKKAAVNAEVLTFDRMAYRVMSEVGGATKTHLSHTGKAMLLSSILDAQKENLKFLSRSDDNIEIVDTAITEFKKHKVGAADLEKAIEETGDQYLKTKLNDLNIVYKEFEEKCHGQYIDENDALTILSMQLEQTNSFKNSVIYIDEFLGYTPQEYEIIKKLLQTAKEMIITICIDDLEQNNHTEDLFYPSKITYNKLLEIAGDVGAKIEYVCLPNTPHFQNNELVHLEQNIAKPTYQKYMGNVEHIHLFLGLNQYTECDFIGEKIVSLVRDKNLRYKDIGIITKDLGAYAYLMKAIFQKYNIPIFIDEKKELNSNPFIKYILSILEIYTSYYSYETMFQYIKSGFLDCDPEDIFKLENYCIKWGIKSSKWKNEWEFGITDENTKKEVEYLNELRKKIIEPLEQLKLNLRQSKNGSDMVREFFYFMEENKVQEKLNDKIKKLEESR